jgi:hypothetical protein
MTRSSTIHGIVAYVLAATAAALPLRAQPSLEYNVKAALLLNFARFIDWPDAAFATPKAPVHVCVFGGNPFGDALSRTLQGETAHNRPLAARQVKSQADIAGCHLLFVPSGTESRAGAVVQQENSFAVTVGESPRFEAMGGAVNLILQGGRVRFNVNLQPVESRGIRISARMLQLANRVGRATPAK